MNSVVLMGRLTKDPDVRYTQDNLGVSRYTLAVDRKGKETDFINCVTFGKPAEFAEKYLRKGMKIAVSGSIQTDSYTKEGKKVYTTIVNVRDQEFAESKKQERDGFMDIPEGEGPFT